MKLLKNNIAPQINNSGNSHNKSSYVEFKIENYLDMIQDSE